tara:strand:+ start:10544 stop:11812 length:1269 start_codon:yes stop_codon:yes gene_type:complete
MSYCKNTFLTVLIFVFLCFNLLGQKVGLNETSMGLASVTLHPKGLPASPPFVPLQEGILTLRFDDLHAEYTTHYIRVRHCTHDWWYSDLHPSEYIDGFYDVAIDDMEDSFGTKVNYTHYTTDIPRDDMILTRSGNYVLEVFSPEAPENVVISRRFVLFEDLCFVESEVREPADVALRRTHQDIAFVVTEDNYSFLDPYNNLHTTVLQNARWDNSLSNLPPKYIKGKEIEFTQVGYVFPGGNSYRFADLKSLGYTARGIAGISEEKLTFHHLLEPSQRRTYTYHTSLPDINGAYVISNDRYETHTGSDYTMAHFTLPMPYELHERKVYLFGELSNGKYLKTHQMTWNDSNSSYESTILLKQGYYNFIYLVKDEDSSESEIGTTADIEGNHFATDNLYTVFVYYSDFEGYDRVVGFNQWNNNPN